MSLRGAGMLITFMDIAAADEAEFNRWYDGEHIAERVGIAGFIAARRFVAPRGAPAGTPKYLPLDADGRPVAGAPPGPTTWIVIVEATSLAALDAVPSPAVFATAGAVPGVQIGQYEVMWELTRDDLASRPGA